MKKKTVMALINSTRGIYPFSRFAQLRRWTMDAKGDPVDRLQLDFLPLSGRKMHQMNVDIKSRDYEGIKAECAAAIEKYFRSVGDIVAKEYSNGKGD